jgi:hypothetical protein
MKRRAILAGIAAALPAPVWAAQAQSGDGARRIGVLITSAQS